jgi:hypothetical protein
LSFPGFSLTFSKKDDTNKYSMKKLKLLIKKSKEKRRVSEICKKVRSHKNSEKIEKQYNKTTRHFK